MQVFSERFLQLSLYECNIKDISPIIFYLTKLTRLNSLYLCSNQIINISALSDLTPLNDLDLFFNRITDISFLSGLTSLKSLDLRSNRITDISFLSGLTSLNFLDLSSNRITDISVLSGLTPLNSLNLSNNRITDISALEKLINLKTLDLKNNPIEVLPPWITNFNMEIEWIKDFNSGSISFYDNPLKYPPVEIVKQGKEAVKNYFEQIKKQGIGYIYEAKLMIVGDPEVGKTSLMNKLFKKDFKVPDKKQKSTTGITVRQNRSFNIKTKNNKIKDCKAHIWDFGGQQIQYMLHQFFLTPSCVYILMVDQRKEIANFDYWLNIINILGKQSRIIVLFNEINIESASSFIYDEKKYKNFFPNLNIKKLDIDLKNMEDGRFNVLENEIGKSIASLEHIGNVVPAKWANIRKDIEKLKSKKQKQVRITEYFEICYKYGLNQANALVALKFFHILGIVLHFDNDENLKETIFLDPNWVVDAIYAVLINKGIEKNNGVFKTKEIDKIWGKKYDYDAKAKLLRLMLKDNFDICYKLKNKENTYIVPMLLLHKAPAYEWEDNDSLIFRFQYRFMPKGIVSRLIVRLHKNIEDNKAWNKGAIFNNKNGARAKVVEDKTTKEGIKIIEIALKGEPNSRRDLLTIIREEIKKIQEVSFPNLPYDEMVPCNCQECLNAKEPKFYDYQTLKDFLSKKHKKTIECRKSAKNVNILTLIDAVGLKTVEIEKIVEKYPDNLSIVVKNDNRNISNQRAELKAEQTVNITIIQENIIDAKGLFENLKEDIFDEIEIEIDDEKAQKRTKKELEKVERTLSKIETAAREDKKADAGIKDRMQGFINSLSDKNSNISKSIKSAAKIKDGFQKFGKVYNKIASFMVLPSIPDIFLGDK
ncbi:MAG: leucine-rich repeat domain-containing protein [Deltaproteobacteria bacterium]|nr:leucine-rich repeat domain-containing protein [Deltaproteobacteria bacterium]